MSFEPDNYPEDYGPEHATWYEVQKILKIAPETQSYILERLQYMDKYSLKDTTPVGFFPTCTDKPERTVLKKREFPKMPGMVASSIILCEVQEYGDTEWVTWCCNEEDGSTYQGNYFHPRDDYAIPARQRAERDFHLRVAKKLEHHWDNLYKDEEVK